MSARTTSTLLPLLLTLLLAACAGRPAGNNRLQMDTIARSDHFTLVRLRPGQSFEDVAQTVLGRREAAWQLREVNVGNGATAGQIVAVPLRPVNASSVYSDGYRTLPILCYHRFTAASRSRERLELTAGAFERQLRYLREQNYHILSLAEVATILHNGGPIPPRSVALTIDDGYRSVYEVAWPLLRKYRAPATLFIYKDFVGGGSALSWGQLREFQASELIEIGSHGASHSSLKRLPEDPSERAWRARVKEELTTSADTLQKRLGPRPRYLSYPYGDSALELVEWVGDAGYELAATVTRGDNPTYAHPLLLHRTMIYADHDMDDFIRFVQGFHRESRP